MASWRTVWGLVGGSEQDALHLFRMCANGTFPEWQCVSVRVVGNDARPHCLATMWGRKYCRTGSGRVYLEGRLACPVVQCGSEEHAVSRAVHMGVPDTKQLRQWHRAINRDETDLVGQQEGEEWLQWTSEVFEAAPDWMARLQVESVWAPVLGLNMKTRDSSVCVSFEQSGSTRRELESQGLGRDVRSVEDMCASVRVMANQIQDRCWAGKKPFTEEEVHVAWAVRPDGGAEGALTLKMRPDVQLHEDILVGTLLAFFIGNSMSHGQGEFLRWCPVLSELGVSSCEVTQITARRGNQLPTRKQIRFGHQRKGVRGWDLSNGRDSTLRQMARVLGKRERAHAHTIFRERESTHTHNIYRGERERAHAHTHHIFYRERARAHTHIFYKRGDTRHGRLSRTPSPFHCHPC